MVEDYRAYPNSFKDRLGARVFKFVVNNAKIVNNQQGQISIECPELWDMHNKEFEGRFGVDIEETLKRE